MKASPTSLLTAMISILLAGVIGGAPAFEPPSEAAPPFRRDRLPIDTDEMVSLSQTMTLLSQSASLDEAPQRRAAAQALALALALDPANSSARDILDSIMEEKDLRDPDSEKLARAKNRVWESNEWLSMPDAGEDGNLLADLLGDAAALLDPDHPSASKWLDSGERGKWDGWVAPIAAFEQRKVVIPRDIAEKDPDDEKDPTETPPDHKVSSSLKSTSASIRAVLHYYSPETDSYRLGPVSVSMAAMARSDDSEEGEEDEGDEDEEEEEHHFGGDKLQIDVSCHEMVRWDVSERVSKPIHTALSKLHEVPKDRLPQARIRIITGKGAMYSYRRNGEDMRGPGFILANAALTGIAPDAFFISSMDREGTKLELPHFFWKKINALMDGKSGGRLVVPAAAEEYLVALLAIEKTDFFLNYEVLVASSPQEAVRLCAMRPDAELASVLAKFKEIKDKSGTTALGPYLANVHVRKRLAEIYQAAPYHLSAKLLAMQGAGSRPRAVTKKILAAEIFEVIDTLNVYAEMDIWEMNKEKVEAMEKAMDESRERIERIERYAEMRDRDLLKGPEDVIAELRTMTRIVRDRRELWEKGDDISRAHRTFRDANRNLRRELSLLTGDPLPKDD